MGGAENNVAENEAEAWIMVVNYIVMGGVMGLSCCCMMFFLEWLSGIGKNRIGHDTRVDEEVGAAAAVTAAVDDAPEQRRQQTSADAEKEACTFSRTARLLRGRAGTSASVWLRVVALGSS